MNRSKLISTATAAFLTAVSCLANAQPVATSRAELSVLAVSAKQVMKQASETVDTAAASRPVHAGLLDTSTTRTMEQFAPRLANTMAG